MTLLVLLITVSTRGLADSAPIYRERLQSMAEGVFSILDRFQVDLGQGDIVEGLRQLPFVSVVRSTAGGVVSFVSNGVLVLIFAIFLLSGRRPEESRQGLYREIDIKIRQYLLTKVTVSTVTGLFVWAILALIGLDLALVFGVLAFFLNFIPNVGSVIATLLPIPLAIVQFDSALPIILVIVLPGVVQMTVGNVIEPKMMGEGLDLHPISILLALVFWGLIWGIVGMLLAAPITAVLRIVLDRFETTRPIARLLAGQLPGSELVA
jgi:AI-2 transport protein TqsA